MHGGFLGSEVLIVGAGPAALAAAVACAERGLSVVVLGGEDRPWSANYGAWADELEGLGYGAWMGPVWSDALVVLDDATTVSTGRRYGRVARRRLRTGLLERCEALGVELVWASATRLRHHATGSFVEADDGVVRRTAVVVDATGHKPAFVRRRGEPTLFQAAVGVLARPEPNPWDPERMVFMDMRTDHVADALGPAVPTFLYVMPLSAQRAFVEETSLVRGPAVPFPILRERLRARLARRGIVLAEAEATELCLFPMDNPLPDLDQRVVGFGAAASMVHPASGYQLGRAFSTAPDLAEALADGLRTGRSPDAVARDAWRTIWTDEDRLRHELHLFGTRLVASLDANDTRRFFEAFFAMPKETWTGYLAARGDVVHVVKAMASMLVHGGLRTKWTLLRSGTGLPAVLRRAAV